MSSSRSWLMKVHTRIWAPSPESSSYAFECTTVSPLHTNLQVANSKMQTHIHMFSHVSSSIRLEYIVTRLEYIVTCVHHLQVVVRLCTVLCKEAQYHLSVSNSSCLFTWCQPLYASCCTILLCFSRYCTVRLKIFSFVYVCFLCIIYVKSIITHYTTVLYNWSY